MNLLPETERFLVDGLAATFKALRYAAAGCLLLASAHGYEGFLADPGRFWWAIALTFGWGLLEGYGGKVQASRTAALLARGTRRGAGGKP